MDNYSVLSKSHVLMSSSQAKQYYDGSKIWHFILNKPITKQFLQLLQPKEVDSKYVFSPVFNRKHFGCNSINSIDCMKTVLSDVLGFQQLYTFQAEALQEIVERKNVLAVGPTNGGKTLLIYFPIILQIQHFNYTGGFTLVISPFLSLKQSQITKFLELPGLPQPCAIDWQDLLHNTWIMNQVLATPCVTSVQFIFLTPEAAESRPFQKFFATLSALERVNSIVVDEAHNFLFARPEFR